MGKLRNAKIRIQLGIASSERLGRKTPCALKGDRCYDCNSPERICNGFVIHARKLSSCDTEIVLVNEALGF